MANTTLSLPSELSIIFYPFRSYRFSTTSPDLLVLREYSFFWPTMNGRQGSGMSGYPNGRNGRECFDLFGLPTTRQNGGRDPFDDVVHPKSSLNFSLSSLRDNPTASSFISPQALSSLSSTSSRPYSTQTPYQEEDAKPYMKRKRTDNSSSGGNGEGSGGSGGGVDNGNVEATARGKKTKGEGRDGRKGKSKACVYCRRR